MVESDDDDEDEVQRMCESEDDADALPVAPVRMDDDQDEGTSSKHSTRLRSSARSRTPNCMPATTIIEPSTPPHLSKKRKLIAEVIISTPSPRKKIKFLHNSDSPDV